MRTRNVVIVGAGFAGLWAARDLSDVDGIQVTIVDRRNHHLFQPLLYQVAMAGLSPADIAVPIRSLFSKSGNVQVRQANVRSIDRNARIVRTDRSGDIEYDALIVASGGRHAYFGHAEAWEPHAPGLKSLEEAVEIRRRVLVAYERAEIERDAERRAALMTFVVVGGGPTGVEVAGAIAEMSRFTLARDFAHVDPSQARIVLVEALPRILPPFGERSATRCADDLASLGVEVRTDCSVTDVDASGVTTSGGRIDAHTIVWAAGVEPSPLGRTLGADLDDKGRVVVESDLALADDPDVFVIGDLAHVADASGDPLPGLAPVAMAEGEYVAAQIAAGRAREERPPFEFRSRGQLATIGRGRAVAELPNGQEIGGLIAWLLWLFVHLYYLIGFRNRFFVFCSWAWSYVAYHRGARLILNHERMSTDASRGGRDEASRP